MKITIIIYKILINLKIHKISSYFIIQIFLKIKINLYLYFTLFKKIKNSLKDILSRHIPF